MDIVFQVRKLRYLEIKNGKSTVEYREAKPYWTKRVQQMTGFKNWDKESELGFKCRMYGFGSGPYYPCIVRWGYKPNTRHNLPIEITKIRRMDGMKTPLKIQGEVYAFDFRVCGGEIDTRTKDADN